MRDGSIVTSMNGNFMEVIKDNSFLLGDCRGPGVFGFGTLIVVDS